jgi:hypothetical protein
MNVGEIVQEDIELKTENNKCYNHLKHIERLILNEYAAGNTDDDAYVKIFKANYERVKVRVKDFDTKINVTSQMMKLKEDREYKQKFSMKKLKELAI